MLKIQAVRKRKGWSLYRLAQKSGISYKALWNIEHEYCDVKLSTLVKISSALDVNVKKLL